MSEVKQLVEWKEEIQPALKSKLEEFHFMGYESVQEDEIWMCVLSKLRKAKNEDWMIHQVVNTVLRLSATDFMNWLTVQAITNDKWQSPASFEKN